MHTAARPPIARLAVIDLAVRGGAHPNARTLARELEVCPRTVQRDIEFLRDRLGAPLVFDASKNGYRYGLPDFRLPAVHLSEGELVAILLAGQVLRQYRGTPFGDDLKRAYERLTSLLTDDVAVHLPDAAAALAVVPPAAPVQDPEVFRALAAAAVAGRRVEVDYFSAGRNARTARRVDPYRLALVHGDWYLIGHCHQRDEVLMFAAHRVEAVRPTGESFERPAGFSLKDYLGDCFRTVRGDAEHAVALRFTPSAAARARERVWHPSQVAEPDAGGGVVVRFTVSDLREVRRWVLSWGAECEALGPPELRALLRSELAELAGVYADAGRPRGRRRR